MSVLKLKHPGTKHALTHPMLQGKKMIGRGWFCAVFDNGDTVLKLTMDTVQYGFYTDYFRPQGQHFPTLIENHGVIGEQYESSLFLVEMEKLTPLKRKADAPAAWDLRRNLIELIERLRSDVCDKIPLKITPVEYNRLLTDKVLSAAAESDMLTEDMREIMGEMASYAGCYQAGLDMKRDNFMLRGDTLIFNDVLSCAESVCSHKSRRLVNGGAW